MVSVLRMVRGCPRFLIAALSQRGLFPPLAAGMEDAPELRVRRSRTRGGERRTSRRRALRWAAFVRALVCDLRCTRLALAVLAAPGSKRALVVVDMQEYFRSIAEPILPRVNQLIDAFHEKSLPVVFTQSGVGPDRKGAMARFLGPQAVLLRGTFGYQLMPELHMDRS